MRLWPPALSFLLALSACGPGAVSPPSDDEIYTVVRAYWSEHDPVIAVSPWPVRGYVTPLGARKMDAGSTTGEGGAATYAVRVMLMYRADENFSYNCTDQWDSAIQIQIDPAKPPLSYYTERGRTIACARLFVFQRTQGGWLARFGMVGPRAEYLIKR